MRAEFRMTQGLRHRLLEHLLQPHSFAVERIAFVKCGVSQAGHDTLLILAEDFVPVDDEDYLDDPTVGARMGPNAIRKALQLAYHQPTSMFHVHCHDHRGRPRLSRTDVRESALFVPDFFNVRPERPHGVLVLSLDSANGRCWVQPGLPPIGLDRISFVGSPFCSIEGGP